MVDTRASRRAQQQGNMRSTRSRPSAASTLPSTAVPTTIKPTKRKRSSQEEAPPAKQARLDRDAPTPATGRPDQSAPLAASTATRPEVDPVEQITESVQRAAPTQPTAPIQRPRSIYADTFEVRVGKNETVFTLHKHAAAKSPYFEAACSERWVEGQEGVVHLRDHEPSMFRVFVHWLYSDQLNMESLVRPGVESKFYLPDFISLWILADYLGCPKLANKIIDATLGHFNNNPHTRLLHNFLTLAPVGTKIWDLMVDQFIYCETVGNFDKMVVDPEWPDVLTRIMARKFMAGESARGCDPKRRPRCFYHLH